MSNGSSSAPGRGTDDAGGATESGKARAILDALGGGDNLVEVEACITRLRVELKDAALVDEGGLRAAGAFGVVRSGRIVQVVVGPEVTTLADDIEKLR